MSQKEIMNLKNTTLLIIILNTLFFYVSLYTAYFYGWPDWSNFDFLLNPTTFFAVAFSMAASWQARLRIVETISKLLGFLLVCALAKFFISIAVALASFIIGEKSLYITSYFAEGTAIVMIGAAASRLFRITLSNFAFLRFFLTGVFCALIMHVAYSFVSNDSTLRSYMELESIRFWLIAGLAVWIEIPDKSTVETTVPKRGFKFNKIFTVALAFVPAILTYLIIFFDFLKNSNGKCHIWMDAYEYGTPVQCFVIWLTGINGIVYHLAFLGWILFIYLAFWPGRTSVRAGSIQIWKVSFLYSFSIAIWIATSIGMSYLLAKYGVSSSAKLKTKIALTVGIPANIQTKTIDQMQSLIDKIKQEPGWIERKSTGHVSKFLALTRTAKGGAASNSEEHHRDFDRGELVIVLVDKSTMQHQNKLTKTSPESGSNLILFFERKNFDLWHEEDRRSKSELPIVGENYYLQLIELALPGEEGELTKQFLGDLTSTLDFVERY